MPLLDAPGELARTPLAALLLDALRSAATGVLVVREAGGESRLYLQDGVPAAAQSFVRFQPLGQLLLAARRIDMDGLARSLAEMSRSGRPQGDVLVSLGLAQRAEVDDALARQQTEYLRVVGALGAGAYEFQPGPVPAWTAALRVPALRVLVDALAQPAAAELATSALGEAAPLALGPGARRLAPAFAWTAAEAALVAALHVPTQPEDALRRAELPAERARAVLAALVGLGVATGGAAAAAIPPRAMERLLETAARLEASPAGAAATGVPAPAPAPVPAKPAASARPPSPAAPARPPAARPPAKAPAVQTEAELRASVAQALRRAKEPDLFARLGVARGATHDEVRRAFLDLARRFHPDRFGAPALADLRPVLQDLLSALNEANEVLGDERRRAAYLAAGAGGAASGAAAQAAALDFQKGEICLRSRELKRARGFYEAAVRADPRPEHVAALAWTLLQDSPPELERAKHLAAQALRDPHCVRAVLVAATIARLEGHDAVAERHFRAVLAAEPGHVDAQRELRALEAKKARRDRARH